MITSIVDWWIGCRGRDPILPRSEGADAGLASAVVVTGATGGIGVEIARIFATRGDVVVLVARDIARLEDVAGRLSADTGGDIRVLSLDLCASDASTALRDWLGENDLFCDILVNSAGIGLSGRFVQHAPHALSELALLNVEALTQLSRAVLPDMIRRRRGGVLNVASLGGYTPGPYQAAYYASKAYVISLTEAIAWELRGFGVRVTCISPGPVETGFHAAMGSESALYRRVIPALTPTAVARIAVNSFWLGRTAVVPGWFSRVLALALHFTPRKILAFILGIMLRPRGDG